MQKKNLTRNRFQRCIEYTIRSPLKQIAKMLWNQIIWHFEYKFCFIKENSDIIHMYLMTILLFQNLYIHFQE